MAVNIYNPTRNNFSGTFSSVVLFDEKDFSYVGTEEVGVGDFDLFSAIRRKMLFSFT